MKPLKLQRAQDSAKVTLDEWLDCGDCYSCNAGIGVTTVYSKAVWHEVVEWEDIDYYMNPLDLFVYESRYSKRLVAKPSISVNGLSFREGYRMRSDEGRIAFQRRV